MNENITPGSSLANRTVFTYPISIGTAVCLEALIPTGKKTELDIKPIDKDKYQSLYINVDTLYRNLTASITSDAFRRSTPDDLLHYLIEEIDIINSVLNIEGKGLLKPHYYSMSYDKMMREVPTYFKFRQVRTEKQIYEDYVRNKVMGALVKFSDSIHSFDSVVRFLDYNEDTLIMTHQPYDLFSYRGVRNLTLLETHSAKTKEISEWNTKYYKVPDHDMLRLPFNRRLYFVFGDRVLVQPLTIRVRREIMEIAREKNWTPMTTDDKVITNLRTHLTDKDVLKAVESVSDRIR